MHELKVFISDTDPNIVRAYMELINEAKGLHIVGITFDSREVLYQCLHKRPDLLIMDIGMADMEDADIFTELNNNDLHIDIIASTSVCDKATISRALRYGVFDYIIKPFKVARFRQALQHYRDYKHQLGKRITLSQNELDQIITIKLKRDYQEMPKNMHNQTLENIMEFLIRQPGLCSAQEVADGVGHSRISARRYLHYLVSVGEVRMVLDYQSLGRPVHRFQVIGKNLLKTSLSRQ